MNEISQRLAALQARMTAAALQAGRDPTSVRLLAVSKGQSLGKIAQGRAAGQIFFGENYAQELVRKADALQNLPATGDRQPATAVEWHFIGHLQRNKVRLVVPHCRMIHSIDSQALAAEIERRATAPIAGLIEIQLAPEEPKGGIAPSQLRELLQACASFDRLRIVGLMCIPPITASAETSRPFFQQLRALQGEGNRNGWYTTPLTELSMGMSHDFEIAIAEGATWVRLGTAIFGERPMRGEHRGASSSGFS